MAHKYASDKQVQARTLSPRAWLEKYATPMRGAGPSELVVPCLEADGTIGHCKLSEAAMVAKDRKVLNTGGGGAHPKRQRTRYGHRDHDRTGSEPRWVRAVPTVFRAKPAPHIPSAPATPCAPAAPEMLAPLHAPAAATAADGTGAHTLAGSPASAAAESKAPEVTSTCFIRAVNHVKGTFPGWEAVLLDEDDNAFSLGSAHPGTAFMVLGEVSEERHGTLFMQSARDFLFGDSSGGGMQHDNVVNAYLTFFKETLFSFASAREAEDRDALAQALVALHVTLTAYFKFFPCTHKFWTPLLSDAHAYDILQRAAAFCFSDTPMSDTDRLRILEVMVKRMRKRKTAPVDLLQDNLAGVMAVLFAVPSLQSMRARHDVKSMLADFNARSIDLLVALSALDMDMDVHARNQAVIDQIAETGGVPKVDPRLLHWCQDRDNLRRLAPLEKWGLVTSDAPSFTLGRDGHRATPSAAVLPCVTVRSASKPTPGFVVENPDMSEWNCFTLRDPGTYTLVPTVLGAATEAFGNTRGVSRVANLRFTTSDLSDGAVIFPKHRGGISSAGREFVPSTQRFLRTGNYLDLNRPVRVSITNTHWGTEVVVQQRTWSGGRMETFWRQMLGSSSLVVGFKWLALHVSFEAQAVVNTGSAPPASAAASASPTVVSPAANPTVAELITRLQVARKELSVVQ